MPASYSGWIRKPRQQWKEHCRHATEDGCWRLLLAVKVAGDCEKRVTPTDAPPARPARQPGLFDGEAR